MLTERTNADYVAILAAKISKAMGRNANDTAALKKRASDGDYRC